MNKEQKQQRVEKYTELLDGAGFAIFTEHGKVSVGKMDDFRRQLDELECQAIVVKNTLAKIVFERKGLDEVTAYLNGPSLMLVGGEEIAPAAKLLQKTIKAHPAMKVKAILFDEKVYPAEEFKSFTEMPTRHELQGQLARVFKSPISMFVRVLNTPQRMVTVLQQYAEKRGEG